ncbi:probable G-protein coupled receptor 82 isoform X2 [Mastacembelus armatus]|uniref:G protein-coupled receptor 82 n=2 Tax=Mastacembelus armatus TaxID=205130 RepID=A0A3Q3M1W2_9TELE|nr:probable G-protein coupled receptor 82 isoform X2 [Mastacembelus armatus]
MEHMLHNFTPGNASSPDLTLCPSNATLFFLPATYMLLFLTALPGNALSLWVFLRCISTISSTHIYLSHLSISNLLLSFTSPFLAAYYVWGSVWNLKSALCQLVLHGITPVLHINIYISLMILTWVALSRFAVLIQHTHASRPSTCTTLLPHAFFIQLSKESFANRVCAVVWLLAVGGIVPVTVYYSVNEAMSSQTDAGHGEVCYNPVVEIGGSLSRMLSVAMITMFFVFYLLVLLSYMTVLRHIRRSRRSTNVSTSHSLLGRVLRNIVLIQIVLSVCLLPYHIFKAIFISLAYHQHQPTPREYDDCHPLSTIVELKNCLLLLAALRGSTDPVMYFILDKTFRHQTIRLLGCNQSNSGGRPVLLSVTGSASQKAGHVGDGHTENLSQDGV